MTQEQFNKVREIVREIDSLEYTKEKNKRGKDNFLSLRTKNRT